VTDIPIRDRKYHLFVSYAHEDSAFVTTLVNWLTKSAGLKVWFDDTRLATGAIVAVDLPEAIRNAAGAIFVISKSSNKSGWVREEYAVALKQRTAHSDYRILVIRLDDTEPPDFLSTTKWTDIPGGVLDAAAGLKILRGVYADSAGLVRKDRDLYISRSWRSREKETADSVCHALIDQGYRLVGDSTDQEEFDPQTRIPALVTSCGALVAIAPNRGGRTSQYIEDEVLIALNNDVPALVIVEDGAALGDEITSRLPAANRMAAADLQQRGGVQTLADVVRELFGPARRPHYAFYAASLVKSPDRNESIRELVDAVAGIDCVVGENLAGQHAQEEIIRSIQGALFMIADVSEEGGVNTLIEAGIARGAGTRLYLLASGEERMPRFMFRDVEMHFYRDELELTGHVHRIARRYRRRILNREL
jgi:hypothetical protein